MHLFCVRRLFCDVSSSPVALPWSSTLASGLMLSPMTRDIGLMQARGQIRGSSIVGFAKGHMHAVGGQASADGVTTKTDGELVSGDSFEVDYGASLQEQQVCRGMRCIDQCEVADLDE